MNYELYLESGPRKRTTMVHVLDLLGCNVHDKTTELALAATTGAIRLFLHFLARHGEGASPAQDITTTIKEHVMEGSWLGYGDPTPGFSRDFEPLPAPFLEQGVRRLGWMKDEIVQTLGQLPHEELFFEPEHGRTLAAILDHLAESQMVYVRYLIGPPEGASHALRRMRTGEGDLLEVFSQLFDLHLDRLGSLDEEERQATVSHGQVTWTAYRALRRSLEHAWEHLCEIEKRLEGS